MVASARFERATPSFGGKYSNPLSYEAIAKSLPFARKLVKRRKNLFGGAYSKPQAREIDEAQFDGLLGVVVDAVAGVVDLVAAVADGGYGDEIAVGGVEGEVVKDGVGGGAVFGAAFAVDGGEVGVADEDA